MTDDEALAAFHRLTRTEGILPALESSHAVAQAIRLAREIFPRLSFDLIYARPGQTLEAWESELGEAISHAADHLSLYQLTIEEGTRFAVFEPNAQPLWERIKRSASDFLTRVWRDGALFGVKPEQAFFVKCDESTNPPDVREAGIVITEIGIAPVKPAEFVVFRIMLDSEFGD